MPHAVHRERIQKSFLWTACGFLLPYQMQVAMAIKTPWVTSSMRKRGTINFHHLSIFTPAIPHIIGVMAVGQIILERPSPNWNARTATCLEIPHKSARGAIIGILVTACPESAKLRATFFAMILPSHNKETIIP